MEQLDRQESAKVIDRARVGRFVYCEVVDMVGDHAGPRCWRFLDEIHHLHGGIGKRVVTAESRDAAWKVGICRHHHDEIHAGRLVVEGPYGERRFRRVV